MKNTSSIHSRLGNVKANKNNYLQQRSSNGIKNRLGIKNVQINNRLGQQNAQTAGVKVKDVRNILIAKKRRNISDARDRLAEIAKQGDAREKLNKLKTEKMKFKNVKPVKKPVFKQSQVQKTVNNRPRPIQRGIRPNSDTGTNRQTTMRSGALTRTVSGNQNSIKRMTKPNNSIQMSQTLKSKTGRYHSLRNNPNVVTGRYHPLLNNPNVVTISNEKAAKSEYLKKIISNRSTRPSEQLRRASQLALKQQMRIQDEYEEQMASPIFNTLQPAYPSLAWAQPPVVVPIQHEPRPTHLRITTAGNYMDRPTYSANRYEEDTMDSRYIPSRVSGRSSRSLYDDHDSPPPRRQRQPAALSSGIMSRLDEKVSSHPGYKVNVSNLHPVVTIDDVEELFGNIGPIKNARIIRPGCAELYFVEESDAMKSVNVYNNRQLDRKPMSVVQVTKKSSSYRQRFSPSPSPSPPPQRRRPHASSLVMPKANTKSVLRAAGGSSNRGHQPLKKFPQHEVAPDLNAIHQALFNARNPSSLMAGQQFFVKLPKPSFK